jgi:phage gp16-like protein
MTARPALAKLAIARKELGIEECDYRDILERLTGHRSARDCSDGQIGAVLDELKAKGWKPRASLSSTTSKAGGAEQPKVLSTTPRVRRSDHPAARKARALWISLHRLGVVRDSSEAALESFGRRQLGVERMQWADQARVYKLIEALKAMAERAGWDQSGSLDEIKARLEQLIAARRGEAA